ncbi:MAG: hypothetical protein BVN35_19925 [Proteobacteria bacterium ST_bin11]|jgi:hypothetical protein|nr:MAG: hypothetical protein BVN35_19925 [Proteobacteria bacterium ST_bin11]
MDFPCFYLPMPKHCRRFRDIFTSEKIFNTVFLLIIGLGYLMALLDFIAAIKAHTANLGSSIDDILIMYHGSTN